MERLFRNSDGGDSNSSSLASSEVSDDDRSSRSADKKETHPEEYFISNRAEQPNKILINQMKNNHQHLVHEEPNKKQEKARRKRKEQRQRKQKERRNFLESMSTQIREEYLLKEKERQDKLEEEMETRMKEGMKVGIKICIDCEYESKMSARENKSLITQLKRVYHRTKQSQLSVNLTITGYGGVLKGLVEYHNISKWYINWDARTLKDVIESGTFKREDVVYLSPDAEEEIELFEKNKIYIIGGLVDGTVIKDISKVKAEDLGVRSMKINLLKYKGNPSYRNCMNINDIYNIMIGCMEGNQMDKCIKENVPKRMLHA